MEIKYRKTRREKIINKTIKKTNKYNDKYRRKLKKIGVAYSFYGFINENGITCCPICGKEYETYHGRQYCYDCENRLKGEK